MFNKTLQVRDAEITFADVGGLHLVIYPQDSQTDIPCDFSVLTLGFTEQLSH